MHYFLLTVSLSFATFAPSFANESECLFTQLVAHPDNPYQSDLKVLAGWPEGMKVAGGKLLPEYPTSAGRGTEGGVFDATIVIGGIRRKVIEKAYPIAKENANKEKEPTLRAFQWAASVGIGPEVFGFVDVSTQRTTSEHRYRIVQRLLYMENLRLSGENVIYSGELRGEGLYALGELPAELSKRVIEKWKRLQAIHPDPYETRNFHISILRNPPESPHLIRFRDDKGDEIGVDLRAVDWRISSLYELEQIQKAWQSSGSP